MKLLVQLLGMLVLAPLLEQFFHLLVLEDLFLTAVFLYAAYSISRNKLLLATAIGLALPAIASTWLKPFVKAQWFAIFGGLCDVTFIIINHHRRVRRHYTGKPCCASLRQPGGGCRPTLPGDSGRLAGRDACFYEIKIAPKSHF